MLVFVSFVSPHYQEILTEKYGQTLFVRLSLLFRLTKLTKNTDFIPQQGLIKAESNIKWFLDGFIVSGDLHCKGCCVILLSFKQLSNK